MARKAIYQHATQVNANTYPDDGTSPVGTTEWNEAPDPQGMYGNTPATSTITIASGVATVTDSVTVVTSESSTTDTLDKLATTNTNEYDMIYLFANTGHNITLTHTASPNAAGQVVTVGGANETLSSLKPTILMRKGDYWYGFGGGTVADGSITTAKIAANAVDGTKIAMTSDATGDTLYYDGTNYVRLAKGSANEVLQMGGSNIPEWGTVQATEIAANAVGASELADDAVDTAAIAADAIDGTKIADNAIDSEHYTDASIDNAHLADDAVGIAELSATGTASNTVFLRGDNTWASAGGGDTIVHEFTNTTTTNYAGTASSFGTVGAGVRDIYIKKIDANNEGVFTKIWKNGSAVEVQIA